MFASRWSVLLNASASARISSRHTPAGAEVLLRWTTLGWKTGARGRPPCHAPARPTSSRPAARSRPIERRAALRPHRTRHALATAPLRRSRPPLHFAVLLARSPASVGGALPLTRLARAAPDGPCPNGDACPVEAFEVHGASASLRPQPAGTDAPHPRELVTASEVEATPAPMPDWAAVARRPTRAPGGRDHLPGLLAQLRQAVAQHTAAELDRVEAQIVSGTGRLSGWSHWHLCRWPGGQVLRGPEPAALRSAEVATATRHGALTAGARSRHHRARPAPGPGGTPRSRDAMSCWPAASY